MNVSKFLVLGTLQFVDEASGYDIDSLLRSWHVHRWTDHKRSSLYQALHSLHREQAVEVLGETKEGAYPRKTLYRITQAGNRLFDRLQAEAFMGLYPRFYGFKLGLKFNVRRSPEEILRFAQDAITRIDNILKDMDEHLSKLDPNSPEYSFNELFIEHDVRMFNAEKEWITRAANQASELRTLSPLPEGRESSQK